MTKLKNIPAPPAMAQAKKAITDALQPYADEIGQAGILALFAQLTGMALAHQDASIPRDTYFALLSANIEEGNRTAVEQAIRDQGGRN